MREILFRGFHENPNGPDTGIIDGKPVRGKWVYGFFWKDIWGDGESCYILYDGEDYPVIPATVGQYTGLTDKNGVKIFEGDILRHDTGTIHKAVFERINGNAYFGWTINELETWNFDDSFLRQLEVIGNIHDNPEC